MKLALYKRTIYCLVFFIIFLFYAGFRWDVGIDWMSYYDTYSGDSILTNEIRNERIEPINLFITLLLSMNGLSDGRYWIWVMTIITLFFIFKSIYLYSSNPLQSILLFFVMGIFFDSLNGIRQYCALSIVTYSWIYVLERKNLKFCLIIIIAILFHFSAVCGLILPFLRKIKLTRETLNYLLIGALSIAPFSTLLAPKLIVMVPNYEVYNDPALVKFASGSGNILSYLRLVFPTFLIIIIGKSFNKIYLTDYWKFMINLTVMGLLLLIAFPTTQLLIRLAAYFQISLIFTIPYIYKLFRPKLRYQFWILTIFYYSAFLFITYISKPIAKIWPYRMEFDLMGLSLMVLLLVVLVPLSLIFGHKYNRIIT